MLASSEKEVLQSKGNIMKTQTRALIASIATAAMLAAGMIIVTPAAQADSWGNGGDRCRDEHRCHNDHSYNNGYRFNNGYYGYDNGGGAFVAGIIGLMAGTVLGNAISHPYRGGSSCEERFRSYNPATGTYTGYDGLQHRCP
jgi:hypothetical protein